MAAPIEVVEPVVEEGIQISIGHLNRDVQVVTVKSGQTLAQIFAEHGIEVGKDQTVRRNNQVVTDFNEPVTESAIFTIAGKITGGTFKKV